MNQSEMDQQVQSIEKRLVVDPIIEGTWIRPILQPMPDEPSQRVYHSAIVHKNSMYIYGGWLKTQLGEDSFTEQRTIYRYNLSSKAWWKNTTNFLNNNSFSYIYSHACVLNTNMMFLFGGKNRRTSEYIQGLWCLNLQSYNWKKQELKGYTPSCRQNASLVLHNKSMIVMYGGRFQGKNLNDINIYRIEAKNWVQIEESGYDFRMPCRLNPAMCSLVVGDHTYMYLFGGERMCSQKNGVRNVLLNDFYQIRFLSKPMGIRPDILVKKIVTQFAPSPRIGRFAIYGDRHLILYGGQNWFQQEYGATNHLIWIYNTYEVSWRMLKLKSNLKDIPKLGFSIICALDKCYIFGELQSKNSQNAQNSGLLVFTIDEKEFERKGDAQKKCVQNQKDISVRCWECSENSLRLSKGKVNDFSVLKDTIDEKLEFVFSAFGLLLDNCQLLGSKDTYILFNHTYKDKYCLIEDNGVVSNLWDNYHQFFSDLIVFKTNVEEDIDQYEEMKEEVHDKKVTINEAVNTNLKQNRELRQNKQREAKQKEEEKELRKRKEECKRAYRKKMEDRKKYSRNFKLGALRIGNKVIFITRYGSNNQNKRVFVLQKIENKQQSKVTYRAYYYALEGNVCVQANMESAKKYVEEQYKNYLKISNERKESKNFLFITDFKQMVNDYGGHEPQLKENIRHNDVFLCQKRLLDSIEETSILLTESLDISLRCYLSLLYLKNEDMKIFLAVGEYKYQQISSLTFFDKIDQLSKSEKIIDLENALDLEYCNIIEVYYNKALKRNIKTFHNGVLIYHQNRLISRYKFNLGQLTKIYKSRLRGCHNLIQMFGFIQIEEDFHVNMFKTNFLREDLLDVIYNRLKFVEKYAEKFLKEDSVTKYRPFDKQQKAQIPKKKFKTNEDGKQNDGESRNKNLNPVIQID